jgi:hypothetical protein
LAVRRLQHSQEQEAQHRTSTDKQQARARQKRAKEEKRNQVGISARLIND